VLQNCEKDREWSYTLQPLKSRSVLSSPLLLFVMDSSLKLPTTIADFISFLEGGSVDPYGDQGIRVIDTLRTTLQSAIFKELDNNAEDFPLLVLNRNSLMVRSGLPSQLSSVDQQGVISTSCCSWAAAFQAATYNNPILISKSQVLSLANNLLEDCKNGKAPVQPNDDRIVKISEEFLSCMRHYLADLRNQEGLPKQTRSLTIQSVDVQDRITEGDIGSKGWQSAWNHPFHGDSLDLLETRLQLHADAIKNGGEKAKMSRIMPVVQASGTGKSRLAEEYGFFSTLLMTCRFVKQKFGVMLSLRNGASFPKYVRSTVLFSDFRMSLYQSTSKMPQISRVLLTKKLPDALLNSSPLHLKNARLFTTKRTVAPLQSQSITGMGNSRYSSFSRPIQPYFPES